MTCMTLAGLIQTKKCGQTCLMVAGLLTLFSPVHIWQVARSDKVEGWKESVNMGSILRKGSDGRNCVNICMIKPVKVKLQVKLKISKRSAQVMMLQLKILERQGVQKISPMSKRLMIWRSPFSQKMKPSKIWNNLKQIWKVKIRISKKRLKNSKKIASKMHKELKESESKWC